MALGQERIIDARTATLAAAWLLSEGYTVADQVFVKSNGTTNFKVVKAGTPVGKITSGGKYRPCCKAVLTDTLTADTTVTVGTSDIQLLRDADVVSLISAAGVLGTVTVTDVGGSGKHLVLTGATRDGLAHTVTLTDPAGNDQPLTTLGHTVTAGVHALNIGLATGGGGAITSTLAHVLAKINDELSGIVVCAYGGSAVGSETATAQTVKTLAGGVVAGGTIAASLTLSSRDTAAGTIVISSSATAAIGDYLAATDGSQTAVGFLAEAIDTGTLSKDANGDIIHTDQPCKIVIEGIVDVSECVGANAQIQADLANNFIFR